MNKQNGNVLFLILIAVALFAALSYAVTQSSRSGGGSAERERSILDAASLTQYGVSLRSAVLRMQVNGVALTGLQFNPPSDFANCTTFQQCVFHPEGGGAVYQNAPATLTIGGSPTAYSVNLNNEIIGLGISGTGADSNDLILYLGNVTDGVCNAINEEQGINAIPSTAYSGSHIWYLENMDNTYSVPAGTLNPIGADFNMPEFAYKSEGCFAVDGVNYYYQAISER